MSELARLRLTVEITLAGYTQETTMASEMEAYPDEGNAFAAKVQAVVTALVTGMREVINLGDNVDRRVRVTLGYHPEAGRTGEEVSTVVRSLFRVPQAAEQVRRHVMERLAARVPPPWM